MPASGICAEEIEASTARELPLPEVTSSIDNAHNRASSMLESFASELDNFFGEELETAEINKTRATVRTDVSNLGDDGFSTSARLKLRMVLPKTQRRVKLLFDVDERDENDSIQQVTTGDADRDFSLAFRFIRTFKDVVQLDFDLGARRFDSRFQTFARVRASASRLHDEGWSLNLSNDYRQYNVSGFANRTSFDCWHPLNEDGDIVFRSSTNFSWLQIDDGVEVDHTLGIYKELQHNSLIALEVLAGYDTAPEDGDAHYNGQTARVRYRKNVYRPWLHYEVWPSVSWLAEDNYSPTLGGLVRLEVQLGKVDGY